MLNRTSILLFSFLNWWLIVPSFVRCVPIYFGTKTNISDTFYLSQCMRFPTIWYMRPAKPLISLRICAVWSEPLIVAWVFYDCCTTDWTQTRVSKLKRRLQRLVWVYTCQNATLFEITCHGSFTLANVGTFILHKSIWTLYWSEFVNSWNTGDIYILNWILSYPIQKWCTWELATYVFKYYYHFKYFNYNTLFFITKLVV